MTSNQQIPLKITLKDQSTFSRFFPGQNQEAISTLQQLFTPESEQFIYIWGNTGTGKSHLIQACCHEAEQLNIMGFYLSCNTRTTSPMILDNVESYPVVCLDNIEKVVNDSAWEEKLFILFNEMRERNHKLVITASCSPSQLDCQLKDLQSRLSSGLTFQLHHLSDTEKTQALMLRAQYRGLELPLDAAEYIIHRSPRDLHTLFNYLNKLDEASLAQQRRLTVPFIRSILFE